jgi:hypothetical protein
VEAVVYLATLLLAETDERFIPRGLFAHWEGLDYADSINVFYALHCALLPLTYSSFIMTVHYSKSIIIGFST